MRVHNIINDYSQHAGGAERLVRVLHKGFSEREIDARVYGLIKKEIYYEQLQNSMSGTAKSPYSILAFYELFKYVRRYVDEKDIIHVHLFPAALYVSILKKVKILKSIIFYTEHNTYNKRRGCAIGKIIDKYMYSEFQRVIAISSGVKNALIEWLPNMADRINVVSNGVDLMFNKELVRKIKGKIIIISVGRISRQKNYDIAIEAVSLINNYNVEYWIAGPGKDMDKLKELSKKLGVENKVKFLGCVTDVANLLEKADIYLIPSLWEGFGLAAVEAMNASLPIVASDVDGLREVVQQEPPCALLINPKKPAEIANALKMLIDSQDVRNSYGKNAFYHSRKFSSDLMIDAYISEYKMH